VVGLGAVVGQRSSVKKLMAICKEVARYTLISVVGYSENVVNCIASSDRTTEGGELERMRKETVMMYLKVLTQNSPIGSTKPLSRSITSPSQIRPRGLRNTKQNCKRFNADVRAWK
jgi:hypothetical protein